MPRVLKKSASGESFSRDTLKCAAASVSISSRVRSVFVIIVSYFVGWSATERACFSTDSVFSRRGQEPRQESRARLQHPLRVQLLIAPHQRHCSEMHFCQSRHFPPSNSSRSGVADSRP